MKKWHEQVSDNESLQAQIGISYPMHTTEIPILTSEVIYSYMYICYMNIMKILSYTINDFKFGLKVDG